MQRLVVLSPHQDDAVFSLAISIRAWCRAGFQVEVFNFFTQSVYAPREDLSSRDTDELRTKVSRVRAREDQRALASIDPSIVVHSLSLLDGPLRLSIDFGSITSPDRSRPSDNEVHQLSGEICRYTRQALVLAPLGLGSHVDHLTVSAAALSGVAKTHLGFYEDLPYASWTQEGEVLRRIGVIERANGVAYQPVLQRSAVGAMRAKQRAVNCYRSQIDEPEAGKIARFCERYRTRERIWAPRHSSQWGRFRSYNTGTCQSTSANGHSRSTQVFTG